jgi:hypothetical protein
MNILASAATKHHSHSFEVIDDDGSMSVIELFCLPTPEDIFKFPKNDLSKSRELIFGKVLFSKAPTTL